MNGDAARKVLSRVMSYEYLWQAIREQGGAYGAGMLSRAEFELIYTYRDPHAAGSYRKFAQGPAALPAKEYPPESRSECIVGPVARVDSPRKPRQQSLEADRRYFCGVTGPIAAADRAAMCGVTAEWLRQQAGSLAGQMARGVRCTFGSREAIQRAGDLFDTVEDLSAT